MVPTVEVLLLLPIETRILSDDDGEKGEANRTKVQTQIVWKDTCRKTCRKGYPCGRYESPVQLLRPCTMAGSRPG